jgi:hypothetical protein
MPPHPALAYSAEHAADSIAPPRKNAICRGLGLADQHGNRGRLL